MNKIFSFLFDLGFFFFVAHIVIFSIAGSLPFGMAIGFLILSLFIKYLQEEKLLIHLAKKISFIPHSTVALLERKNIALYINGVFLLCLGLITLLDILLHIHSKQLFISMLVAANSLGFGIANMRKAEELDGFWNLKPHTSLAGYLYGSLGRPESICVFASFPASLLASVNGTYLVAPILLFSLLLCLKTGKETWDKLWLNQEKRVMISRIFIGLANLIIAIIGFYMGNIEVSIGLTMFFIGNCIIAYQTYQLHMSRNV